MKNIDLGIPVVFDIQLCLHRRVISGRDSHKKRKPHKMRLPF